MKEQKKSFDYRTLFILGISFSGVGVVFLATVNKAIGLAFIGISITYMIIGLKNKDKWQKK
jgi:hypothetical protein